MLLTESLCHDRISILYNQDALFYYFWVVCRASISSIRRMPERKQLYHTDTSLVREKEQSHVVGIKPFFAFCMIVKLSIKALALAYAKGSPVSL